MSPGGAGAVRSQVRAERRKVRERGVGDSAGEPGEARGVGRRHGAPVGNWAGGRGRVGLGFRGSLCAEKPNMHMHVHIHIHIHRICVIYIYTHVYMVNTKANML